jgi:hypothetical protein
MMVRVEGPSAAALQSVFAHNWLRVSGEILTGGDYFANANDGQRAPTLVIGSMPAAGSTRTRILFQPRAAMLRFRAGISLRMLPPRSLSTYRVDTAFEYVF